MANKKSGWAAAKETVENSKGSGLYVRLEDDGDKIVGSFVGEPLTRELCWNEKTNSYEEFTPEQAKAGRKMSPKFAMNVFVPANEQDAAATAGIEYQAEPAVKVWECSKKTFEKVIKCLDKYGHGKWCFEIERNGAKGDTKTTYTILPERELTADERKQCGKPGPNETWLEGTIKLHDLEEVVGSDDDDDKSDVNSHDKKASAKGEKPAAAAKPAKSDDAATISTEAAQAFVARLKVVPREKLDKFLAKFGIAKVKELRTKDAVAAEAFLSDLEKPAEDDAFAD